MKMFTYIQQTGTDLNIFAYKLKLHLHFKPRYTMNYKTGSRVHKTINTQSDNARASKSDDNSCCMICTRAQRHENSSLSSSMCSEANSGEDPNSPFLCKDFCSKCIGKQICKSCILQITALPCAFCHTNNKQWRFWKRKTIMEEITRKVNQKRVFWGALNIHKKNIHLQHAIRCGIEEFIQIMDGVIEKLADDIKYLVKIDFDKEPDENEADVIREIEEINELEERYDSMMVDLKDQFHIDSTQ